MEILLRIYNLNELTDSKILYDKSPPAFMKYIILTILISISVFFLLANKSIKIYTLKSNGIIVDKGSSLIMKEIQNNEMIKVRDEKKKSGILIESIISPSDIQKIHKNNEVEITIKGINGIVKGEVVKIDEGISIKPKSKEPYFKVFINPKRNYLEDENGLKTNLIIGMNTESEISYKKSTYIKYFFDKLGIE